MSSPLVLTPQHVYQEMKQLSAAEAVSRGGRLQETAPPNLLCSHGATR